MSGLKSESIYASLKSRIIEGALAPGERLRLSNLARLYGTSEIPVREALRMLARDGLVEMTPYHGARVVTVETETLYESYFVRAHLESLATSLAASRMSEDQIGKLEALIREMAIATVDNAPARYATLNREFHREIIEASGNRVLRDVLLDLETSQAAFQTVFRLRPARLASSNTEHQAIVGALREGDAATAGDLALAHKLATAAEMVSAMSGRDIDSTPDLLDPVA